MEGLGVPVGDLRRDEQGETQYQDNWMVMHCCDTMVHAEEEEECESLFTGVEWIKWT